MVLTGVPFDQLPADVQKRLKAKGVTAAKGKKRTTRKEVPGPVSLRCHACGEHFTSTTGAKGYETHSDATGHRRFDNVLVYIA